MSKAAPKSGTPGKEPAKQAPKGFQPGIVEGFFGQPWSWSARWSFADFMQEHGFRQYLYAPKADRSLRQEWTQPFSAEHLNSLALLSARYQARHLDFAIGLSPLELYRNFNPDTRQQLIDKVRQINRIKPSTLCLLFDDMPGDLVNLARVQSEIMDVVMTESTARHFMFCPTYYSFDPILRKLFGKEPVGYLSTLGEELPPQVQVLWTGPKVISEDYPREHLEEVAGLLQRKPVIWDNYPVNDGRDMTDFLHLWPGARDIPTLQKYSAGHLLNPMNQAFLSRIPLLAASRQYRGESDPDQLFEGSCLDTCGPELGQAIIADIDRLHYRGLARLEDKEKAELKQRYAAWGNEPCAQEILRWLDGDYQFDPDCLT